MEKKISQVQLMLSYFKNNPDRDIPHPEVVDWAVAEWKKLTGGVFRDPDRAIRTLRDKRLLLKVTTGVYRYDPNAKERVQTTFTPQQKEAIFERDGYKCVVCGHGKAEGLKIHADHIHPREEGGESIIDNGQTLCAPHNFKKKNFKQTETGKKMFIRLHNLAHKKGNEELAKFCDAVLDVYEEHDINGHIKWDKKL